MPGIGCFLPTERDANMGRKKRNQNAEGAQPGDEKPSFWKTLPGIITGVTSVIVAIAGLLTAIEPIKKMFSGSDTVKTNDPSNLTLAATNNTEQATSCTVGGRVCNDDIQTSEVGVRDVKIAYVTTGQTKPTPMAITDIRGQFRFTSLPLKPAEFPIHLQLTYLLPRGNQIIDCEQFITPAGNLDVYIPLSPSNIAKAYQSHTAVMRISANKLIEPHRLKLNQP
jgi:hypothetical protein